MEDDLMSPFWAWMGGTVILAFIIVMMAVRLLIIQQMKVRFFVLFGIVGSLLLICVLLAISSIGR